MNIFDRYGIKEVSDVTFYEVDGGGTPLKPVLYLDTLKISNFTTESTEIETRGGKGDAPLISWDIEKEATLELEDALFSPRSLGLMFGEKEVTKKIASIINKCEFVQVKKEHFNEILFEKGFDKNKGLIHINQEVVPEEFTQGGYGEDMYHPYTVYFNTNIDKDVLNFEYHFDQSFFENFMPEVVIKDGFYQIKFSGRREDTTPFSIVGDMQYSYEINNQNYHINQSLAKTIGLIPKIKENNKLDQAIHDIRLYVGAKYLIVDLEKNYSYEELSGLSFLEEKDEAFHLSAGNYILSWELRTYSNTLVNSVEIEINADTFPGIYYVTADTWVRDETTGEDKMFQIVIPKAKVVSENHTIAMESSGDPAVFNITLKALKSRNKPLAYLTMYESELTYKTTLFGVYEFSEDGEDIVLDYTFEDDSVFSLDDFDEVPAVMTLRGLPEILNESISLPQLKKGGLDVGFTPVQKTDEMGNNVPIGNVQSFASGLYTLNGYGGKVITKPPIKQPSGGIPGYKPEPEPEPEPEPISEPITAGYVIFASGKVLSLIGLDNLRIEFVKQTKLKVSGALDETDGNIRFEFTFEKGEWPNIKLYVNMDWVKKHVGTTRSRVINGIKIAGYLATKIVDNDMADFLIGLAVDIVCWIIDKEVKDMNDLINAVAKELTGSEGPSEETLQLQVNGKDWVIA